MEMMNRAFEDASDFMEMKRKLMENAEARFSELAKQDAERLELEKLTIAPPNLQKQPGENREQYRERMRRERKAAAK
jgi:hypothetical protein